MFVSILLQYLYSRLMLYAAEMPPAAPGQPPAARSGLPVWAIVLIVVVALLCLIPICIIVILTLLGPAIGTVFSNIIENLPTLTPSP